MITEIIASNIEGFDNHEKVYKLSDDKSGLIGYIAIHNTNLGPATGGTRWIKYNSENEALKDVLHLSKSMTYKCALANLKFGGGKGVICSKIENNNRNEILKAYAECVNELEGLFTTGMDAGIDYGDTVVMASISPYILGQSVDGIKKEDTSKMAALGVFKCIKEINYRFIEAISAKKCKVAVKGVGKLGSELVRLLIKDGFEITIADNDVEKLLYFRDNFSNIKIVDADSIHKEPVDIYSPCALGNEFNFDNIKEVGAKIIAGGANNQLKTYFVGNELYNLGIIYLPDYIINSGGLINIVDELEEGGYSIGRVQSRIDQMSKNLLNIVDISVEENKPIYKIADDLAEKIIFN